MIQHLIPSEKPGNGVYIYSKLIDEYIKDFKFDQDIIHVELGYGEYELFWQVYDLIKNQHSTKLVLTVHDAPIVVGKPFAKWFGGGFVLIKIVRKLFDIIVGRHIIAKLVRRADAIIVLNAASIDSLITKYKISKDKIFVSTLPSLTPLPKLKTGNNNIVKLIFFGNISRRKGLDVLVEALLQIHDTPLELDVVGSSAGNSQYESSLKQLIRALPKTIKVTIHGYLNDRALGALILNSDIVVLPYREEGVIHASGPLATSMSAGKAIICSDVAAFNNVINDKTGIVFAQDDVDELAHCIQKLVSDAQLRQNLGRAAAAWSNSATSRASITKTLQEVYSSL